ncbi:MAG: DUF359 domain-containing protein [Candidatus Aenigmarchaeota archaeon]|nr:DUF359 domain-containing protein [Candidatus Aenigmarchaeota archaeon]
MIVAVTGTPATGKSSSSSMLAGMTGWKLVSLNELAERKRLYKGYDNERGCKIVDTAALRREISSMQKEGGNLIIESHYAHEMPSDLVIVLTAGPGELRKRAGEKGWEFRKTEENVMAEIMEVCKTEALELGKTVRVVDTTGSGKKETAESMAKIMEEEGLWIRKDLKIPASVHEELREPYGKLFKNISGALRYTRGRSIATVGDMVSYETLKAGIKPGIVIIDGRIKRNPSNRKIDAGGKEIPAENPTGYITADMFSRICEALSGPKPVMVRVKGEEDMAVLPLMLFGREGLRIIYGLFDKGVCVVSVDKNTRKAARNILKKISSSQ